MFFTKEDTKSQMTVDADHNSGNSNSGSRNSGHFNSGDFNSGSRNSGNFNSGSRNSDNYNSGNSNSGSRNSGNFNSGNFNSGHFNSGHFNSGNHNSGFFNTNSPKIRFFNKETDLSLEDINIPYIYLPVSEFIHEKDMTSQEKINNPNFYITKGYTKTLSYHEAWAKAWNNISFETKQQFFNLPNFDAEIFKEITGIDVTSTQVTSCNGKIVEIDGKKYKLTEV